ncbi:MAG TPA: 5-oxoprolinase subunit PxpA [Candidatus Acidoferrum sp.]|nr:5-oxoprolinase subunit PxpA [Candidatus Acidoferrum sp.]
MDLNCDMGEIREALADGTQEELMRYISSANIACGGHAGDVEMMRKTVEQALSHGVHVGAHPGYEDRADFGRKELELLPEQISDAVHRQILALEEVAAKCGAAIGHVKPHGALYNQAACDRKIARAIADGVRRWRANVILVGLAGSVMLDEFREAGFPVAAEAFADRRYEQDGSLRSRKFEDALLDPKEAAQQALRIVEHESVIAAGDKTIPIHASTICIHGDAPAATEIAAAVHRILVEAGITIRALSRQKSRRNMRLPRRDSI